MARKRRIAKLRTDVLTWPQRLELTIGPGPGRESLFDDDAHRRAAWAVHGASLLAAHARGGQRPWACWRYEVPPELWDDDSGTYHPEQPELDRRRERDLEAARVAYLARHGLLSEAEIVALRAAAVLAIERLASPALNRGPDLHGTVAYFAHQRRLGELVHDEDCRDGAR